MITRSRAVPSVCCYLLFAALLPLAAQTAAPAAKNEAPGEDIAQLKVLLANQQKQIEELNRALQEQKKMLENLTANERPKPAAPIVSPLASPRSRESLGEVASTTAIIPGGRLPAANPATAAVTSPAPQAAIETPAPLQLRIGNAFISPVGFMDMTSVSRSTNPGSGIGTNFGSVPYGNTQAGSLTETRFSIQNSRIGARIDTGFKGFDVTGYWESDFLGQIGSPPNGGLAVTSNPYVFRMRLYWVDVIKNKFEFLAGQSWSLMTPGRTGISPFPSDVFYSQDVDVNYQLGLVWGRIPGYRAVYHFTDKAAFAVALENSEPYVGGGNGGSAIVGPAAIYGTPNATSGAVLGGQINNGSSTISAAAVHPDIIAKLAFDPTKKFHFEVAGVEITDKIANPASTPAYQTFSKAGGGGSVNLNFQLFKGFRVLTNNYYDAGGGRYIFGQAPDFMIRANGSLSLIHSASTVTGFEATAGKTLFYVYYGGVYIAKIGLNRYAVFGGTTFQNLLRVRWPVSTLPVLEASSAKAWMSCLQQIPFRKGVSYDGTNNASSSAHD